MTKGTIQEFRVELNPLQLSRDESRLLLGASLRLLAHRSSCGIPVLLADLVRLLLLADDAEERELETAGV